MRERKIPPWATIALLVAGGAVLFWPSLTTPFFLDDYLQSAIVHGRFPVARGPFDLYDFVGDDDRAALLSRGFLPWWTDPHLTLRFLRPLSSLLLYGEHRWLEAWPMVMHLHSFAWWVGAVLAARSLFGRLLPARPATIATIIFALAPCHALPIGWLANREALIALTLGTVGLSASLRFRGGGSVGWALLSLVSFGLALAAGEYALGIGGYVLAFAWRAPRAEKRRGSTALLFVLPAVAYLVAARRLGYGAEASGFYHDPLRDTLLFVGNAPWRTVCLLLSGWFSLDWTVLEWDGSVWPAVVVTVLLALWGRMTLLHVSGALEEEERWTMWTLLWGSLMALLPLLAVVPSVRLLGVAMLGIAPVVAMVLETAWFRTPLEARHGVAEWTAIAAMLLGFAHLVHAPGRGWVNGRQTRAYAVEFGEHAAALAERLRGRVDRDVVVVAGLDDVFFYVFALDALGVRGSRWTVLAHTGHVLCLRKDASSVELVVGADSSLFRATTDLYRSDGADLAAGDTFALGPLGVRIEEMAPSGPRRARFQLDRDLDDPRWLWVGESRARGFYDAQPPRPGFGAPFEN